MARWQKLNLSTSDGHTPVGQLCLLRMQYTGVTGVPRTEYRVGRFVRDDKDPSAKKLWWLRGDAQAVLENPAHWRIRYDDVQFVELAVAGGEDRA